MNLLQLTIIPSLYYGSINELKHEYNGDDDIPQGFEVSENLKIELRW